MKIPLFEHLRQTPLLPSKKARTKDYPQSKDYYSDGTKKMLSSKLNEDKELSITEETSKK